MFPLLFLLAVLNLDAAPELPATGAIEATIRGTNQPLDVALLQRVDDVWREVDRRNLAASVRQIRFDALNAGVYQLLIAGAGNMEQLGTKFVLGDGDVRHAEIAVDPVTVTGRVTLGGTAAGPVTVSLRHKDLQWRSLFPVAADGTFRITLWQRGSYLYSVRGAALTTSFSGNVDLEGDSPIRFLIEIPEARITGVVRDASNGAPVSSASVFLQSESPGGSQHVSTLTDRTGRFEFNGLRPGKQTIRVVSGKHLEPVPVVIDLDAATKTRAINISLDTGRTIPVVVLDAGDHPLASATVFAVTNGHRRSRASTNESGSISVSVPRNDAATLFVIPNDGGFAAVTVAREQTGRLTIHLPRASSSLRLQARTTDGKPMPPLSLLMRFNGELMPPEIADELGVVQGLRLATTKTSDVYLTNIPSGRYEFWPYRTTDEAESIIAVNRDVKPPVQVDVHDGENTIVVKFAAR